MSHNQTECVAHGVRQISESAQLLQLGDLLLRCFERLEGRLQILMEARIAQRRSRLHREGFQHAVVIVVESCGAATAHLFVGEKEHTAHLFVKTKGDDGHISWNFAITAVDVGHLALVPGLSDLIKGRQGSQRIGQTDLTGGIVSSESHTSSAPARASTMARARCRTCSATKEGSSDSLIASPTSYSICICTSGRRTSNS